MDLAVLFPARHDRYDPEKTRLVRLERRNAPEVLASYSI